MTFEALWPLLLLPLLGVVVLVALRSDLRWPKLRLRASLALRLLAAALLLLALCRPVIRAGSREVAVAFVVDVSRSVASESMQDAVAWAREASRALGSEDAHFVAFADRAVSVPDADALLDVQVFDSGAAAGLPPPDALDQGRTNIEAALRHAAARLPPDRLKRVVLFSDGRETEGDTAAALAFLKEAGVRVFPAPSGGAERRRRLRERDPVAARRAGGRDDRGRSRGVLGCRRPGGDPGARRRRGAGRHRGRTPARRFDRFRCRCASRTRG